MKKIMLILISVIMLFSACDNQTDNSVEESIQTQIDPTEEFGGITFGMTQDEVINLIGEKPYSTYGSDDIDSDYNYIVYHDKEHFTAVASSVTYCFKRDDGALRRMVYDYSYNESDYESIKEEIIRRYPEEICTYFFNDETDLTIYTENRSIFFHASNLHISIFIDEYRPGVYDTRSDTE
ncbi:MAG: hypothetical protein J1E40_03700 [Oscillospiraceae bacterium]|nr:hypothetical protein [Oscillospiraceae bacterium]